MIPAIQAVEILSPDEHHDISQLVDTLIAAGFPDVQSATLYSGDLDIRATSGLKGEEPLLPCDASQMQETTDTGIAYRFNFSGLNTKLPTGTWLIGFNYRYTPRPTDEISDTKAIPIDSLTLTEKAHAAHPFDAATQAGDWLALLNDTDRPRILATMNLVVPVSYHLKISPDNWPAAVVLLSRAGWPEADLASLTIADQRARSFWQLRPWTEADVAFDPTGAYPHAKADEQTWKDAHKTVTLEKPATALRRGLFRFFKSQINRDDAWLPVEVAVACSLSCLDPADPQGNAARITALRKAHDVPLTLPDKSTLAARLQSWEGSPRRPRMSVSKGQADHKAGNGDASIGISTTFASAEPAYTPQLEDLDALVALLDDPRPSRWIDFSGARSVGDNAWRALAVLLKQDPRSLANIPVDKPWTSIERSDAAKKFAAWWKEHGTEHHVSKEPSPAP